MDTTDALTHVQRVEQQVRHFVAAGMPLATIGNVVKAQLLPAVDRHIAWAEMMHVRWSNTPLPVEVRAYVDAVLAHRAPDAATRLSHARDGLLAFAQTSHIRARLTPYERTPLDEIQEAVRSQFADAVALSVAASLGVASYRLSAMRAVQSESISNALGSKVYAAANERPSFIQAVKARFDRAMPATDLRPSLDTLTATPIVQRIVRDLAVASRYIQDASAHLFTWVESRMPDARTIRQPEAYWQRVDDLRHLEQTIARVTTAERRYASSLGGNATELHDIHRAPLTDVAMAAAYHRVIAHADPLVVFKETLQATKGTGTADIARAIEVACTRRLDLLLSDAPRRPAELGTDRLPLGWDIEPRRWAAVRAAHATNTLGKHLARLANVLPTRDAEYQRIEQAATRLIESDMVVAAIAAMRPVTAGVEPDRFPKWTGKHREFAPLAFQETESAEPAVTSDGEIISWSALMMRHPHFQSPPTTHEQSWIATPSIATAVPTTTRPDV
jgi:hypothetical protein